MVFPVFYGTQITESSILTLHFPPEFKFNYYIKFSTSAKLSCCVITSFNLIYEYVIIPLSENGTHTHNHVYRRPLRPGGFSNLLITIFFYQRYPLHASFICSTYLFNKYAPWDWRRQLSHLILFNNKKNQNLPIFVGVKSILLDSEKKRFWMNIKKSFMLFPA